MSVTPNDFLLFAAEPKSATEEMAMRNSVSRAYYSGYLHANQKAESAKISLPVVSGGVHARLISAFEKGLCDTLCGGLSKEKQSEIAGLLSLTKKLRTKADYRLHLTVNASEKATAIASAKAIQELLT
ncbi:TPA: hypothetical protein SLO59_001341 [Serratia marcescens]|nr:hypothetical protein [Serratia marcescens]HEJ7313202.1 hypothetical protein [Serratia marcescens]